MDAGRFDALLRSLGELPTRRGIGRVLAGLVVGGGLGSPGLGVVEAKSRKRKKKKKGKKKKRPAFCAGKDGCVSEARCERSGNACHCFVTAETGEPYCGLGAQTKACGECTAEETCVDFSGIACGGSGTGCSLPCPDPL